MNHLLMSCHSHLEEFVNLADELHDYHEQWHQHRPFLSVNDFILATTPMAVNATPMEGFQEDIQNVDGRHFIQEYLGAASKYGCGTTILQRYNSDHVTPQQGVLVRCVQRVSGRERASPI